MTMILIKVVPPKNMPEGIPMPTYVYDGDDEKKAAEYINNFYSSNPIALMGSRRVELVRVVETETIATIELPEANGDKMVDGLMSMIENLGKL